MFKKSRVWFEKAFGLSGLIIILNGALSAPAAHAWGLSTELNTGWLDAHLVKRVIERREIVFCLQIEDARFAAGPIARQFRAALSLWLRPLQDLGVQNVAIRQVDCTDPSFNVKVQIGRESNFTTMGSYQLPTSEGDHLFSLIKIDSAYAATVEGQSQTYPFIDFEAFVPAGQRIDFVMRSISIDNPQTVQAFAASRGVAYDAVYWSTYRVLIHEAGHSFGLCDTYDSQVNAYCDPAYRSPTQPSSVMKDSNYFYLTQDDVSGIQALFRRFMR